MDRITTLHEQAAILRTLAASFEIDAIRDQLLGLAAQCDEMARSLEEHPRDAGIITPADVAPDLH